MRRGQAHRIGLRGHVFRCVAGPLALLVLLDLLASATLAVRYAGRRYDADLLSSGRALAKLVEQRDDHVQLPAAARFLLAHEGHRSLYFQVVDRQGRTVAGNAHLTGGAKAASADVALYDLSMPDGPARVARLATSQGGAAAVAVGEPLAPRRMQAARLVWLATLVQLPILLAVIVVTWLAVGAALRALKSLVASLDPASPRQDLPDDETVPSELASLSQALRRLLARMNAARHAQERFVVDASRRLRLPLDRLRAAVDRALRSSDAPAREAALRQVMRHNEQATRVTRQLLALARLGPDHKRLDQREVIDLDALLQSLVARRAEDRHGGDLDIGYEGPGSPLHVRVDGSSIDDVLEAWIDDSLQQKAGGGWATVTLRREKGGGAQIAFTEKKAGPEHGGRSFALMLARRVARLHGAQLSIQREGGARTLTLHFPAGAQSLS